jgi:hypothetical protein
VTFQNTVTGNFFTNLVDSNSASYAANSATSGYVDFWGASLVPANQSSLPYQRVNTSTDYDADPTKFPRYLRFDGSDDWLQTNTINFTSTDKMTVFAGVRKLSDATFQNVIELGPNSGSTANSFLLGASANNGTDRASWLATTRGATGAFVRQGRAYASPITNVVSAIHDIAGNSYATAANVRVNGANATTYFDEPASAGPTGGGNFRNDILYIGRRAGTVNQFNGQLYSMIIRGAATDAATIANAEKYVAGKTGVTL